MGLNHARPRRAYVPLAANYYWDDRIGEAGEAAELLYVRALSFCASMYSDGFITRRQAITIVGIGMTDVESRIQRLIDVGLWIEDEGDGFWVASWLKWNRSFDEIGRIRSSDAARKRRERGVQPDAESVRSESERTRKPSERMKKTSGARPLTNTDTDTDTDSVRSQGIGSDGVREREPTRPSKIPDLSDVRAKLQSVTFNRRMRMYGEGA